VGAAAKSLAAAGARHIYVVGGAQAAGLRQAGFTFIDDGCDALAILEAAHDMIGLR
jgi:hypothetical protein